MSEEPDPQIASQPPAGNPIASTITRRSVPVMAAGLLAIVVVAAVALWFWWPKPAGKPVPAPRSVTFEQSSQTPIAGEQRLMLSPEQLQTAQLQIETVGEQPSSEAAGQLATGVVQANAYQETPVV